ncbi:PRC-barrel domain-containing protein [Roseomonas sp. GC11]|uniref:PRC-barrel domain-containing protein n=1 Tax=Roseomonas sp. GC11 TaxID=2950546 RepID=UPI00210F0356|nr:PRC-barrel domain-containing protein [Roseomonas sp. GC11]MCQ4160075.1 PRC-barrel domain-containing protein [Roseomonas sp. GC11]
MRNPLILAGAAALLMAAPALAQTPTQLEASQRSVNALTDRDVYSSDNVDIGEIEDVILNAEGRAVLAIIEVEGRLGLREKYVALPFGQVTVPAVRNERATLAMTAEQVKALPGFRYAE